MSKKMYVILMCVILIAVVGGILAIDMLHYNSSSDVIVVGSTKIAVPQGYEVEKVSDHGTVISNNDTKMSVYYSDSPTNDGINDYVSKHKGDQVTNSPEHYSGVTVYKYILLDNKTKEAKMTHLFFDKNGSPYHFSIKGDYDKSAVEEIIIALS